METIVYLQKDSSLSNKIHEYEQDIIMHEMEIIADRREISKLKYKQRELAREYIGSNKTEINLQGEIIKKGN